MSNCVLKSHSYIICPYCRYKHVDFCDYELDNDEWREFECEDCNKVFYVYLEVKFTYISMKNMEKI